MTPSLCFPMKKNFKHSNPGTLDSLNQRALVGVFRSKLLQLSKNHVAVAFHRRSTLSNYPGMRPWQFPISTPKTFTPPLYRFQTVHASSSQPGAISRVLYQTNSAWASTFYRDASNASHEAKMPRAKILVLKIRADCVKCFRGDLYTYIELKLCQDFLGV